MKFARSAVFATAITTGGTAAIAGGGEPASFMQLVAMAHSAEVLFDAGSKVMRYGASTIAR